MNSETKVEIQLILEMLRRTLVENGVSISIQKETGEITFFDTQKYFDTNEYRGFKVSPNELVK